MLTPDSPWYDLPKGFTPSNTINRRTRRQKNDEHLTKNNRKPTRGRQMVRQNVPSGKTVVHYHPKYVARKARFFDFLTKHGLS